MNLKAYICPEKIPAVETDGRAADQALSFDGGLVRAKIQHRGCDLSRLALRAQIMPEAVMASPFELFACLADLIGEGDLAWTRRANIDANSNFQGLDTRITIDINHPASPCFWVYTSLYFLRGSSPHSIYISYPLYSGGMMPADGGRSDFYQGHAGKAAEIANTQTLFVPGELLQLKWGLRIDGRIFASVVAGKYFASPAFTGGRILSSTGDGQNVEYMVDVQGRVVACAPTDFADYQIGDWVFLLKQGNANAAACERETSFGDSDADSDSDFEGLRVAPVSVNDVGNDGNLFETLNYNMLSSIAFREFFELTCHIGTVTAVNPASSMDVATVEINEENGLQGTFEWVPVFYHCQGQSVTAGGRKGFLVDDEVLVLNKGGRINPLPGDLIVIGHRSGRRYCDAGFILIISSRSGDEAIAWDLATNSLLVAKATYSDVVDALAAMGHSGSPVEAVPSGTGAALLPNDFSGAYFCRIRGSSPYTMARPINPDAGRPFFYLDERFFGSGWGYGDQVVFRTHENSAGIDILSSDVPAHDAGYILGHETGSVDADWTATIFQDESTLFPCFAVKRNDTGDVVVGQYNDNSRFYPIDDDPRYLELAGEDGQRGAYLWYYYSEQKGMEGASDLFKARYEALTGQSWPAADEGAVARERLFLNPVFGFSLHDAGSGTSAYLSQMKAATETIFDSWLPTDYYAIGSGGIEANIATGVASTEAGDLVFDWTVACYDLLDGICNDYENSFRHIPHIYHRPVSVLSSPLESALLEIINSERVAAGLAPLAPNANLQAAAAVQAEYMASVETMTHSGDGGSTAEYRILAANYLLYNNPAYQSYAYGENIAAADMSVYTAEQVAADWMASAGHRANILYADYLEAGMAIAVGGDGRTYICNTFGFRDGVWPGFAPMDPADLVQAVENTFDFEGGSTRLPKLYIL